MKERAREMRERLRGETERQTDRQGGYREGERQTGMSQREGEKDRRTANNRKR